MYVIYNRETTEAVKDKYYINVRDFGSKAAVTRYFKEKNLDSARWTFAPTVEFFQVIEKSVTKKNMMTGKDFTQKVNTPLCCDPSSETYWSM